MELCSIREINMMQRFKIYKESLNKRINNWRKLPVDKKN